MNKESDNLGFVPYNFDPEYSGLEIIRCKHLIAETNNTTIPLFCTTPTIFQNVDNPSPIIFQNVNNPSPI
jgi:hypothetical protein